MHSTLFHIPHQVAGVPLFGVGLLLAIWALASLAALAWSLHRHGPTTATWGQLPLLLLIGAVIAFLLPALSDERGLPIRSYGVMVLLGVVGGVALAVRRARRVGIDAETIFGLAFWMILGGFVGARAFYVIEYWEDQFARPTWGETLRAVASINEGGLVVYGALAGALLAGGIFVRRHRLNLLVLGDVAAPSMALGLALGRIGCFLNGCCFGGACDLPWAVQFPRESPPYVHQLDQGLLVLYGLKWQGPADARPIVAEVSEGSAALAAGMRAGDEVLEVRLIPPQARESIRLFPTAGPDGRPRPPTVAGVQRALLHSAQPGAEVLVFVAGDRRPRRWVVTSADEPPARSHPVHPAQLYSALDAALLCLFLLAYTPFARRDGAVLAMGLTLHPISRFLLEIIRTDEKPVFGTSLSISQNISILILLGAILLWAYIYRQPRRPMDTPPKNGLGKAAR